MPVPDQKENAATRLYAFGLLEAQRKAAIRYNSHRMLSFDTGREPIEDAPLFGGNRQRTMFSDLDWIDPQHDEGGN